ncbi:hypothetical protein DM02DRAFT_726784 [Periconia macrospinosa]|uniref:Zn(2)-C6 fungal-type domain-containing protein n=1 Tax=Periconia macrospinosa TaxID=97972 RepID=A0A2V1DXC0_9PLEO|nr:hypothetical protein DM02DRAFT_726784 [Periconia macrospinosa]
MSVEPNESYSLFSILHEPSIGISPMAQKRPSSTDQPSATAAPPPRRRRARYTWRACDVCRRRKGRCDGRKPCDFCHLRSITCNYSPEPEVTNDPVVTLGEETGPPPASAPHVAPQQQGDSIAHLVIALQGQVDSLIARMEASSQPQAPPDIAHIPRRNPSIDAPPVIVDDDDVVVPPATTGSNGPTVVARHFHGPTSPDYSLKAAEIKLRKSQETAPGANPSPPHDINPSLEDEQTDEDDESLMVENDGLNTQSWHAATRLRQCLAQLSRILTKNKALRLLNVYHDVIGNLHPFVDINHLKEQVEALYIRPGTDKAATRTFERMCTQENTVLILFLVLSIALSAETVSQSITGKTLYQGVQHLVKLKIASEVSNLDDVEVVLLASLHHFFNGAPRLAWRTCGVSGRMAMELGLHRRDGHQYLARTQNHPTDISALFWSILILDRQWSAATGLPHNFQDSDFDQGLEPPENSPYIKAMISYTSMSPKFEVPIHTVAAGGSCDPVEAFEILNFQTQQWLKKALEGQQFFHPCPDEAIGVTPGKNNSAQPSAMATLLYLRANAFRSIILRPFFLSSLHAPGSIEMIKPSLAIISDTLKVLCYINSTTDIYRKQHPFFQHFLSSSCALLFLIVAYVGADQQRGVITQSPHFPKAFSAIVKEELDRALSLASAYSNVSQTSCRVSKKLRLLRDVLSKSDFLQPAKDSTYGANTMDNNMTSLAAQPPKPPRPEAGRIFWGSENIGQYYGR